MLPRSLLFGTLALPWFVHASVVLLSLLGTRPLAGRLTASFILIAGGAFALCVGRRGATTRTCRDMPTGRGVHEIKLSSGMRFFVRILTRGGAAALACCVAMALLSPVVAYDALWYRLPTVAQWLDAGQVYWVESDDPVRNGYPLGQEAISAVIAAATSSFALTDVTSFAFVVGGALSIWWVSEGSGVQRPIAQAAGALFLLVPMILLNAGSGYSDAAFAGATVSLLSLAALLTRARDDDYGHAAALGMAAANVLALKGTGLGFVFVAALGVALALHRLESRRARCLLVMVVVCAMLPGAYWALRNVAHTGNPLWPVQVSIGNVVVLPGLGSVDQVLDVQNNTPATLATSSGPVRVLRTWLQLAGPAVTFDDRWAGLGWAWPLLALPSIALSFWQALGRPVERARLSLFVALGLLTLMCLALQPMRWWSRYTLWLWGAGAVAIAYQAQRLLEHGKVRRLALLAGALSLLMSAEASIALFHAHDAQLMLARFRAGDGVAASPRSALSAKYWVPASFWSLGLDRRADLCRGAFKPNTDDAILDGLFAQLTPRPRMHIIADDHGDWQRVLSAVRAAHCEELLLLRGSPVLHSAVRDPSVSVSNVLAFDPLYLVQTHQRER